MSELLFLVWFLFYQMINQTKNSKIRSSLFHPFNHYIPLMINEFCYSLDCREGHMKRKIVAGWVCGRVKG